MANTHDYTLANQSGSAFRTDLNTLLQEVEASNAGATAPSELSTGKLWYDTANALLKQYDGSAWVVVHSGATPDIGTPSAGVVTNLSGVLPVGVTGGSGLTALGTVASGTLGSAVNLNHDAKKNSWHIYRGGGSYTVSAAVLDFNTSHFVGSNVAESGGRITVTTAGLYWIATSISKYGSTQDIDFHVRVNTTYLAGTRMYRTSASADWGSVGGGWAIPMAAGEIVDVYGSGDLYGGMSFFSGTRIGAIS